MKKLTLQDCINYASQIGYECLSDEYIDSKKKMIWKCSEGHIIHSKFNDIRSGYLCKVCGYSFKRKETYIKRYGVDNPSKNQDIQNKKINTCLKKYGVENAMQNRDIFLKSRKNMIKNSGYICHWNMKQKLYYQSSYEEKVIKYFNSNKIDFDWQIPFDTPYGKYFIDCYLPRENLYIEIKGYFFQDLSRNKWNWFNKNYSNSKLWDKNELEKMGII